MEIKIKPLRKGFMMPERKTKGSAAYDAILPENVRIKYGRQIIPLGWSVEMDETLAMDSRTRAGYAAKGMLVYDKKGNKYRIDADVQLGLIDSDYRGEVGAIVICRSWKLLLPWVKRYLHREQAIGQVAFWNVPETELVIADELSKTDRGGKGFGKANGE